MEFRVLGTLEVVEDGRPIRVERRLTRALLAYLLLHANTPVSGGRLIDELWGQDAPRTAAASLQNYVSRLRKIVGERLRREPAGYVLAVDPELYDLARFERLFAEALASPARQRVELLRAALALWRGEPLEDLAFEEFAQQEIAQLSERRLAALEERIDAELELGHDEQLVQELETLTAAHPLRERFRRQLMLALYRAGRHAEALDTYRAAQRLLRDELGLEPSEELRTLERAILSQDPGLLARVVDEPSSTESRRTVTVLVCEVSDVDAAGLDPETYRRRLHSRIDAIRAAVDAHGGVVEQSVGDAALAFFGVSELHEDDALRAVRAAMDVRESLAQLDEPAIVRIAVSTGEFVVSTPETRATGAAVNVASNLVRHAAPGEVVLGDETRRLVREAVVVVGGGAARWRLEGLVADAPAIARRFDAPFVGRKQELRRLRAAFARARRDASSGVVTLVGEAGIGKTRLLRELLASVEGEARALVGRCVSYGAGATYLPLAEIVRQLAPQESVAGVAALLPGADDADDVARRIGELVGLGDAPAALGEAFWAVRRLLEAIAREQPTVLVLDDLHWAEPTLLDLVEYIGEWVEAPLLVVGSARPELLQARPGWGGPTSSGFVVELEPLPAAAVSAIVEELASSRVEPDVQERVVARAGGNPLFAEQLLALAAEAPDVSLDTAPPTVEALIASRLELLDTRELDTLRRASVIGRRFSRSELADLGPVDDAVLLALARKGLVHAEDGGYSYHHVLVRDVAYRGIPKAERVGLHERAAHGVDRRDGPDEVVGYHLEQAYAYLVELARVDDRALQIAQGAGERLARAGVRAWKRADAPAAENLLGRAARLLPESEASRVALLSELAVSVWAAGDPDRADDILAEAVATAAARADRGGELRARLERANLQLFRGEDGADDELLDIAAQAVPVFEELADDRSLGRAWLLVSYVQGGLRCGYAASLQAAERARDYSIRSGWPPSGQQVPAALFYGPTPVGRAIERCEALLDDSDRLGEALVRIYLGGLWAMKGRVDEGRRLALQSEEACGELGMAVVRTTTHAPVRAEIEMLAGDPAAAEQILRESCSACERMRDRVHLATQAAQLADALYAQGDYEEAERWTHVAEVSSSATDVSAALSWRAVRGKTCARLGATTAADAFARAAVELAARTDALLHHARVLLDLAEVLRLGDRAEAASSVIEEALRLYERKENDVAAGRARALLAELALA